MSFLWISEYFIVLHKDSNYSNIINWAGTIVIDTFVVKIFDRKSPNPHTINHQRLHVLPMVREMTLVNEIAIMQALS